MTASPQKVDLFDDPALNPAIDCTALAGAFECHGRIQVQRFLTRSAAQRLYSRLTEETPCAPFANLGEERREIANPSPAERQGFTKVARRQVG
jgi:hypothetical protein